MKQTFFLLALCLLVGASAQLAAIPKNVILIRHAEKAWGANNLNLKGFERAAALSYYFAFTPLYNNPPIAHIFAAGLEERDSSIRPIQTCTPIANYLKIPLNTNFKPQETNELAREILTNPKYDNSTVLICSSHGKIGEIVQALGADDPGNWSTDIFDQAYLVKFTKGKKPICHIILQKLMYGDRVTFNNSSTRIDF